MCRPQSGRCLGREAERVTKSREVDLSRLKGFHLRFAPKNEKWHDLQLVQMYLRLHLEVFELNGGKNRFHSDRPK